MQPLPAPPFTPVWDTFGWHLWADMLIPGMALVFTIILSIAAIWVTRRVSAVERAERRRELLEIKREERERAEAERRARQEQEERRSRELEEAELQRAKDRDEQEHQRLLDQKAETNRRRRDAAKIEYDKRVVMGQAARDFIDARTNRLQIRMRPWNDTGDAAVSELRTAARVCGPNADKLATWLIGRVQRIADIEKFDLEQQREPEKARDAAHAARVRELRAEVRKWVGTKPV